MPSDDFNRADNASLGANWSESESGASDLQVLQNKLQMPLSTTQRGLATWVGAGAPGVDQESELVFVASQVGTGRSGPGVRMSGTHASVSGYVARLDTVPANNTLELVKFVNNNLQTDVGTSLGSFTFSGAIPTLTKVRIRVVAAAIEVKVDGIVRISANDAAITTGAVGVFTQYFAVGNSIHEWDNWLGVEIIAGGGSSLLGRMHRSVSRRVRPSFPAMSPSLLDAVRRASRR